MSLRKAAGSLASDDAPFSIFGDERPVDAGAKVCGLREYERDRSEKFGEQPHMRNVNTICNPAWYSKLNSPLNLTISKAAPSSFL